jgi:hypothetical protein
MAKVQRPSARPSLNELAKIINQLRVALDGVSRVVEKTNSSVVSLEETVGTGETVWNSPPAPVNLVVSGAFNAIFLTWGGAEFAGYSHTEIYRADTDNLSEAVLIGTSYALVYSDTPPNSSLSKTYYYWIRFANRNDPPTFGPFNAAAGTPGSTADDPSYLLELLFERLGYEQFDSASGVFPVRVVDVLPALPDVKWPEGSAAYLTTDGKLYRTDGTTWDAGVSTEDIVGKLTAGQIAAGAIVAEHIGTNEVIANSANIKDGVIVNAKIANLAVDNAKISDLSVAKLLAGVISAAGIYLGADSRVHLDGQNQRIDVRDTNNTLRVRLGNTGSGWGLTIYDVNGNIILSSGGVPYSAVDGGPPFDADKTSENTAYDTARVGGTYSSTIKSDISTASSNASTALSNANTALTNANEAIGKVNDIGADNKVTPAEKKILLRLWEDIDYAFGHAKNVADGYGIKYDDANAARKTLLDYLSGTVQLWAYPNSTNTVNRNSLNTYFADFRDKVEQLLGWINNGAVNPGNKITSNNQLTYISSLLVCEARIGDAAVGTLKIQGNAVTMPEGYSLSTAITCKDTYNTVAYITIDPKEQTAVLFGCCKTLMIGGAYSPVPLTEPYKFRILRGDGQVIGGEFEQSNSWYAVYGDATSYHARPANISFSVKDNSPQPGNNTYYFQVACFEDVSVSNRTLIGIGLKR